MNLFQMFMRGKSVCRVIFVAITALFLASALCRLIYSQNYEQTYFLATEQSTHQISLSVTHQLYEYYLQKDHQLTLDDFASFVTPYAFAQVAIEVTSLFEEEEDFVNAILMICHQIEYQVTDEPKYPVETIIDNRGDCDLLSYVAASIILAHDVDVILLYYEHESHMNIGVNLPDPPQDVRSTASYIEYNGSRYYVAECTGDDWQNGWRVGECPPELEQASVAVIALEDCELIAPGQVSASLGALTPSTLTVEVSPRFIVEGNTVEISGQVRPSVSDGEVAIYALTNGNWEIVGTATLDLEGRFSFSWRPAFWGQHYLKASWSGDSEYAGADSTVVSIYVLPETTLLIGGIIVIVAVSILILLLYKATHSEKALTLEENPVVTGPN